MSMYRKKPVVIEAVQLTKDNGPEVWEWANSKPFYAPDGSVDGLTIFTLEGRMKADFGDWIIKGVQGEFYPCKPDIFAVTYELVPSLDQEPEGTVCSICGHDYAPFRYCNQDHRRITRGPE